MRIIIILIFLCSGCSGNKENYSYTRMPENNKKHENVYKIIYQPLIGDKTINLKNTIAFQYLPLLGRADLAAKNFENFYKVRPCPDTGIFGGDVLDHIIDQARHTSVVIINEGHDKPYERAFVEALARGLKPLGYDYFAAETFTNGWDEVDVRNFKDEAFIRSKSGFYSNEPVFGREIRTIKALGYELVPYEQAWPENQDTSGTLTQRQSRREEAQANNLINTIFNTNKNAKVLIHAGGGHSNEISQSFGGEAIAPMAMRLKQKLGIDPLTINQFSCRGGADMVRLSGHPEQVDESAYDLYVDHPLVTFKAGRPTWRRENGEKDIPIPSAFLGKDEPVIVDAHYANEPYDAVPVDRIMLDPGETLPLILPPGHYKVTAITKTDVLPESYDLVVH
jgi:hypothetical protein